MMGKLNRWTHSLSKWTHDAKIIGKNYVDGIEILKGQDEIMRCSLGYAANAEEIKVRYNSTRHNYD